jgi:hypothetical protein
VSEVSSTPNKRKSPKNHSPKRKLFSQRKSLVEFTPVSEDEKRMQSSKYMYKPNLQLHHIIEVNSRKDARGCNRVMRVAEVACAQKKAQHSKDVASHDRKKSGIVVCNTKRTCQDTGTHQENAAGKLDGSFRKENTTKDSSTLVQEGNLLKLRGASGNSALDNTTLNLNNEANKNDQELQMCLTHCDSLVYLSRSSSSESQSNIVSEEGTEIELNVPTCPDSAQEMLDDDDKVLEEQVGRDNLSSEEQTVLSKESEINVMSVEGGNEGEMLNSPVHESISDKGEEGQWKSSRHVLQDRSVMEELSCGKPQDKVISGKSSCELNLRDLSDNQSLLKNDHSTHKVTICPKTQSSDKNAVTKSLSQSSCFERSESHSCSHDNSVNGEDIAPGRNGHNILKLTHNIPDNQNNNGKLAEKAGNEGEEIDEGCMEKHLNLILMQSCGEENENNSGKVGTDGNREDASDVSMFDMYKVYGKNAAHLNVSDSINYTLNGSVYTLEDNQFEVLDLPEIIFLRADGNHQESGTGDTEHGSKETPGTRILSANSRTTDNNYHDMLLTQPDPTVSNSKVSYLPAEKKIPSVRQNGCTVCTELAEKELIGPLPTDSDKKSGQSETQATLQNGLGTGQTIKTRCNSKSSLTSGRNNPMGRLSLSTQVTENHDKCLSQADSSLWKSGNNTTIMKCKENEDCITSTPTEEKILDNLLSQGEEATSESCHTVNMLAQTDDISKTAHFSSSNSSLSSCMERSCELVPENITASTDQQSPEESSFCCSSQELVSPPSSSSLPAKESGCRQKKGNFLKFY